MTMTSAGSSRFFTGKPHGVKKERQSTPLNYWQDKKKSEDAGCQSQYLSETEPINSCAGQVNNIIMALKMALFGSKYLYFL